MRWSAFDVRPYSFVVVTGETRAQWEPHIDASVANYEGRTDCRKPASFAVALYCGIGSSSLKTLVKALATGKWSLLAVHNNVHNPFWSFDSKWVYFHGTDGDALWRVRVKDRAWSYWALNQSPPTTPRAWQTALPQTATFCWPASIGAATYSRSSSNSSEGAEARVRVGLRACQAYDRLLSCYHPAISALGARF